MHQKQNDPEAGTSESLDCNVGRRQSNLYTSARVGLKAQPAAINFATVLADINDADDDRDLYRAAAHEFARINGWNVSASFHVEALVGRRFYHTRRCTPLPLFFDHTIYFRRQRRCVAIATQPYVYPYGGAATSLAASLNLSLHIPSNPRASIHAPGHAFFLVFTARGHVMRWLPEQAQVTKGEPT
jgi:hypothetical protein